MLTSRILLVHSLHQTTSRLFTAQTHAIDVEPELRKKQTLENARKRGLPVSLKLDKNVVAKDIRYCMDLVRTYNQDAFLCTNHLIRKARSSVFAVRAYDASIVKAMHDNMGSADTMRMKLLWWREVLGKIHQGSPPNEPVCRLLTLASQRYQLPVDVLKSLVDARMMFTSRRDTIADVERHSDRVHAAMLMLSLKCSGVKSASSIKAAAFIGRATGFVSLLRGIPFGSVTLGENFPADILKEHKLDPSAKSDDPAIQSELCDVTFALATRAKANCEEARKLLAFTSPQARRVFLMQVPLERYLAELERCNFNVNSPEMFEFEQKTFRLKMSLWEHRPSYGGSFDHCLQ
eukprot:315115_1